MRLAIVTLTALLTAALAPAQPARDVIPTPQGELGITFIGHGTLMFAWQGKVIHVDPWSRLADYATLPRADLVLITHAHGDHLDPKALAAVRTPATEVIASPSCEGKVENAVILANGQTRSAAGVTVTAVPAYNLVHRRDDGRPYHPRGEGNGYVLTFGELEVLVAGDTENVPELKALKGIDIAFLPMNLPYTMTPEMVADLARAMRPRLLYPYHYGDTDPQRLVELLGDTPGIEVRIRPMR
ncbi:MAG: MBL fold metallo-hydrolase [Acidobacteriota bacterium]|jgi:L-ascorbate metabolism protein UlaG (beta-lactamase superfamily)